MAARGKTRVGVLMSGGVDSSVAAALLQRQGYDVIGITLQLWDYENAGRKPQGQRGCCDISHQIDARFVCQQLGLRHVVVDLRERFEQEVVRPYEQTYLRGQTPNPCVACNSRLKWGATLQRADALDCDYIATGHYARLIHDQAGTRLLKGLDPKKDQSYALWQVPREALARTLLPLGQYSKGQIRQLASELELRTADKAESQEVCFIPDHYGEHLREAWPEQTAAIGPGEIVDGQGRRRGEHQGFFEYTIGQRRGLNISDGQGPYYVVEIDAEKNRVVIGGNDDLRHEGLLARQLNWIGAGPPTEPTPCEVKVRYNDDGAPATLHRGPKQGEVIALFDEPVRAVTPGQSVVFYRDDEVWGGGIIGRALRQGEARQNLESGERLEELR